MNSLVVILNYCTPDLTIQCLRSLAPEMAGRSEDHVIVADGASDDDSVGRISDAVVKNCWSHWVSVVPLLANNGYAAGNNAIIRESLDATDPPKYVLILNPDTVATPHAVGALAAFMDANPRVGIVGSQLEGLDGAKQCSAFRFPSLISELESTMRLGIISRVFDRWRVPLKTRGYPFRVDWVSGASFMVRASLFRQIGLLDEAFFLYFEEVDFCKQAQKAGWECWQVPESRVAHMPGQSTGVSVIDRRPERRPAYWFESRRRYFVKNHGWLYAVLVDLLWMLGHSACRLKQVLLRRPNEAPPHLLWDFVRYSNLVQAVRLWRRVGNHPVRAGRE